jgi:aryl-alcohol dehydrogenase (NADP+)
VREETDTYGHGLYYADADYDVVDRVVDVAKARGVTPAQVALAWMLAKPGVTSPIIGASKMPHLDQAVEAMTIRLSDDEITRLEEPYVPHRVLGIS